MARFFPANGFLLALLLALSAPASAQETPATLVDRIVAVVDGDPILLSDLTRAIAFDPTLERQEGESEEAQLRRALTELIGERIRYHEVDRAGAASVPAEQIEMLAEAARSRFPTEAAFLATLAEHGMTEEDLRGFLARRQAILTYVENRLRAQVFVDATEIQTYYDTVLRAEQAKVGLELPPLDSSLREQVRRTLTEVKLNEEEERWFRELERKADVVQMFDRREDTPPTVIPILGNPPP